MSEIGSQAGGWENIVFEWWKRYCAPDAADSGIRARLRRCRSATEALAIPAAVLLARQLGAIQQGSAQLEAALGLARLLAHVTAHTDQPLMRAAGWPFFPENRTDAEGEPTQRPRLSEVRFRRVLLTQGGEEQLLMFVRLVRLIGSSTDVRRLARDFLSWHRDSTRRRWAFEYYAADVAAPPSILSPETDA